MGICSQTINRIKPNKKFVFNGPKSYNLITHKIDGINDYIIEMILSKFDINKINEKTELIIVLDISGSMKVYTHKLISIIIPNGLNLLNYSDNDLIHLITFQSFVNYYKRTIRELKNDSSLKGFGGTNMSKSIEQIKLIFSNGNMKKNYRILFILDGSISDKNKTLEEMKNLRQFIINNNFFISIGLILYKDNSKNRQADKDLILQILNLNTDNTKTKILNEISSSESDEFISKKIFDLFKDDCFKFELSKQNRIRVRIDSLYKSKNIFFVDKKLNLKNIGIFEDNKLKYSKEDFKDGYILSISNYNIKLGAKIDITIRKVRINGTSYETEEINENKNIISYFENLEEKSKESGLTENELKKINHFNVINFNNTELAQFIGVENNMVQINEFLKDFININELDEDTINDFVGNTLENGMKIDLIFDNILKS